MLYQSEIRRLPVLDIGSGKILGLVCQIIFDYEGKRLAGVGFSTWTWGTRKYIHREDIRGIGDHAVTIPSHEVTKPLKDQPELMLLTRMNIPILGSQVITAGGKFLGTVEDYILEPVDYGLVEILLSGSLFKDLFQGFGRVPAHLIMAIGRDAIVVRDNALATINTNGRPKPSESAPKPLEDSFRIPGDVLQDIDNPQGDSTPFDSVTEGPFLVALPGKQSSGQSGPACSKNRPLANVRYLRRVDEILGVRYQPSQAAAPNPILRSSFLEQAVRTGKAWFEKAITMVKPGDSR
jgi:uncharacterized protein YrrD